MNPLSPEAITVVLIPFFYLLLGGLSISSLLNTQDAELPPEIEYGLAQLEVSTSTATHGRWLRILKFVGLIVLVMTVTLLCFMVIAQHVGGLLTACLRCANVLATWYLFGVMLNPGRKDGQITAATLGAVGLAVALIAWPDSWFLNTFLSLVLCSFLLLTYRDVRFRVLALVSVALLIYDVLNVYGTGFMVDAALALVKRGLDPSILTLPDPTRENGWVIIGMGDVCFPGFWMMLAFRMAYRFGRPLVVFTTTAGIMLGWIAAHLTMSLTQHPVPALLFLVPGASLGYLATALPQRLKDYPILILP